MSVIHPPVDRWIGGFLHFLLRVPDDTSSVNVIGSLISTVVALDLLLVFFPYADWLAVIGILVVVLGLGLYIHERWRDTAEFRGFFRQNLGVMDKDARKWRILWKKHRRETRRKVQNLLVWPLPCLVMSFCVYAYILRPLAFGFAPWLVTLGSAQRKEGDAQKSWRQLAFFYGPTSETDHVAPRSLWETADAQVSWLKAGFKEKANRAVGKIFEGMIYAVWGLLLNGLWRLKDFVFAGDRPLFKMRMNISLNVRQERTDSERRKCYTFHMRTVEECACSEFLPGSEMNEILETSMDHAEDEQNHRDGLETEKEMLKGKLKGRFITVQRNTAKQINDQIVNRLSKLFGTAHISWDMGQAVDSKEYIYAMTYEADEVPQEADFAKPLVKKFRVLLMEKERFLEMTSNRQDDNEMLTPRSGGRLSHSDRGISATVQL